MTKLFVFYLFLNYLEMSKGINLGSNKSFGLKNLSSSSYFDQFFV